MNDLKIFQNSEFGELGILIIDGKEYFPATACAKILGHENPQRAIRKYCKGVTKTVTPSNGGTQEVNYIPEGDLYRLIIRSKLPSAERFERWIFDEVLPTLRKTGSYIPGSDSLIQTVVAQTTAAVMAQLPAIISETVKTTLNIVSSDAKNEEKPKRRRINYHGKIDHLPVELRNEVISMIFEKKYTYMEVSDRLKEKGHDVHYSSIGRFSQRLADSVSELTDIQIES